jgi:hypothetical protein
MAESSFKFKTEVATTKLTGKQHASNDVFTTHTGTSSCDEINYVGEQVGTEVNEVTLTPSFVHCKAFGLFTVPIEVNGCAYRFKTSTKTGSNYAGIVDIVCPNGKVIEIKAPGCTVTIGSQSSVGAIQYTNIGTTTTREVTMDFNILNIKYEEHRPFFGICSTNTMPTTGGTYSGAAVVTGENPVTTAHRGFFVQ